MKLNKKITLPQLAKLVKVANYDQLSQIPKYCFPDEIPKSIIKEVPYRMRSQLETLLFDINAYQINLSNEIERAYGADVQTAFALAKFDDRNQAHRLFKDKVVSLVHTFNQVIKESGPIKNRAFTELHESVRGAMEEVYAELKHFDKCSLKLNSAMTEAERNVKPDHKFALKSALNSLSKRFFDLDKYVSLYLYVNIHLIIKEMSDVMKHIKNLSESSEEVCREIEEKRTSLATLKSSLIGRISKNSKIQNLQHEITMLQEKLKLNEAVISESNLLGWLDTLVESSMSEYVKTRAKDAIQSARLNLFKVLHKYCEIQENTAKQVALNPFTQVDPESSIQYAIKSEEFVLNYFTKKKTEVTVFLQGSAQKRIDGLTRLEEQLISEMRKNLRNFR